MATLFRNRAFDAYIGRNGTSYVIYATGVHESRRLPSQLVNCFQIKEERLKNRSLYDYINNVSLHCINGKRASEWVLCHIPEDTIRGFITIDKNGSEEPTITLHTQPNRWQTAITKSFTLMEFNCWFGSTQLPQVYRKMNDLKLERPESMIDISPENMKKLQLANIEKGKRQIALILQRCNNRCHSIEYKQSYLHSYGKETEPYKMIMVLGMNVVTARMVEKKIEVGMVYFGDELHQYWLFTNGVREKKETIMDICDTILA